MVQEASKLFNDANSAFIDEEYETALSLYTKAIEEDCSKPEYYLKRCIAYQKVNKYKESISDAEIVLKIAQGDQNIMSKAYLRKGIAEFEGGLFVEAKNDIDIAGVYIENDSLLKKWKKKIDEKVNENPSLFQKNETSQTQQSQDTNKNEIQTSKVRHEWFQNENFVTVSVFIKKVNKDTVTVEFNERSLSLSIKLPTGSEFCFDLEPLAHEIIPNESKYSVLSTKIEMKLKKKVMGIKWTVLEGEDETNLTKINVPEESDKPSYPSSSKKKYDWNALEKSIEDEKPEGDEALNRLFQQIYRDASDETKRAMMKSYIESNGTCLSTNWAEVGKGKVECKPPEGMIAKSYKE